MDFYKFEFEFIKDENEQFRFNNAFYIVTFYALEDSAEDVVSDSNLEDYPNMSKQEILLLSARMILEKNNAVDYICTHARIYEVYRFFIALKKLGFNVPAPKILLEYKYNDISKCRTLYINKQLWINITSLDTMPSDIKVDGKNKLKIQMAYSALNWTFDEVRIYDSKKNKTIRVDEEQIAAEKCIEFANNEFPADFDAEKDFVRRCDICKYVPLFQ